MEYLHQAFAFSRGMQGRQICHCEGRLRPWQSRAGTADPYWLPLKWHVPIASVAALTAQPLAALPLYGCGVPFTGGERHWQLQVGVHPRRPRNAPKFVIARPQRGRGALSAKREEVPLGCNFAVPGRITGKSPANMVPLRGGASRTPPPTRCVRSAMACTSRKCLPEIATSLCSSQ